MTGQRLAEVIVFTVLSTVVAFVLTAGEAALQRMSRVRADELADDELDDLDEDDLDGADEDDDLDDLAEDTAEDLEDADAI